MPLGSAFQAIEDMWAIRQTDLPMKEGIADLPTARAQVSADPDGVVSLTLQGRMLSWDAPDTIAREYITYIARPPEFKVIYARVPLQLIAADRQRLIILPMQFMLEAYLGAWLVRTDVAQARPMLQLATPRVVTAGLNRIILDEKLTYDRSIHPGKVSPVLLYICLI